VIDLKAQELSNYLTEKRSRLNFLDPGLELQRKDSDEIRKKILALSYSEWKKLGLSKGSLWYMKKIVKENINYKKYNNKSIFRLKNRNRCLW
jgi:CRISPR-associated protein Cas1